MEGEGESAEKDGESLGKHRRIGAGGCSEEKAEKGGYNMTVEDLSDRL